MFSGVVVSLFCFFSYFLYMGVMSNFCFNVCQLLVYLSFVLEVRNQWKTCLSNHLFGGKLIRNCTKLFYLQCSKFSLLWSMHICRWAGTEWHTCVQKSISTSSNFLWFQPSISEWSKVFHDKQGHSWAPGKGICVCDVWEVHQQPNWIMVPYPVLGKISTSPWQTWHP